MEHVMSNPDTVLSPGRQIVSHVFVDPVDEFAHSRIDTRRTHSTPESPGHNADDSVTAIFRLNSQWTTGVALSKRRPRKSRKYQIFRCASRKAETKLTKK